jgi:uncharacterized membrane protein YhfC
VTLELITTSRLKAYRACPRLHHNRYDLGIRPAEQAEALTFGTLGHVGLEAWWLNPTLPLPCAMKALAESPTKCKPLLRNDLENQIGPAHHPACLRARSTTPAAT